MASTLQHQPPSLLTPEPPVAVNHVTPPTASDPVVRKQVVQDLMAQMQGTYNFMQVCYNPDTRCHVAPCVLSLNYNNKTGMSVAFHLNTLGKEKTPHFCGKMFYFGLLNFVGLHVGV